MRRSAFLLITGLGAAAMYALGFTRVPRADSGMARIAREQLHENRAGRCASAHKRSRWSGYTVDDLT